MADVLLLVPSSPVQVEPVHIGTVLGRNIKVVFLLDLEVEGERVDGYGVLARVVLHDTRQEGLGEEEARDPEGRRLAVVIPGLQARNASLTSNVSNW